MLGLACGTGRLLCRLAAAGFEAVGIDLSEAMLLLARGHAGELGEDARARVRLLRGDMSDFHLRERFGLIFIADNSLREQKTRGQLLSCLGRIREHLQPGGVVLITERRFDPALYPDGRRSIGWSDGHVHPQTGETVSRRIEIVLSEDRRSLRGNMIYKTTHADGTETIEDCPYESLLLRTEDYLALFSEAGLETQVFVGYEERPDDGRNPMLCFVCRPCGSGGARDRGGSRGAAFP